MFRICVRFASTFNVVRVAVLTYDLVICKDSNDCLTFYGFGQKRYIFMAFYDCVRTLPYILPSHCQDSDTLHIKNCRKSNRNVTFHAFRKNRFTDSD